MPSPRLGNHGLTKEFFFLIYFYYSWKSHGTLIFFSTSVFVVDLQSHRFVKPTLFHSFLLYCVSVAEVGNTFPVNKCLKGSRCFTFFLFLWSILLEELVAFPMCHSMQLFHVTRSYVAYMFIHFQWVQTISHVCVEDCTSVGNCVIFCFLHFAYTLAMAYLLIIKYLSAKFNLHSHEY